MSTITIEIPNRILEDLQAQGLDVKRFILEAVAVHGYRQGALTQSEIGELLVLDGLQTAEFFALRRV